MAYDLKYDTLLRAIESGHQSEAQTFFERRLYDVNEGIRYLFEDGKRFTVTPLYWAVRHNCPKLCRYLLRNGARPYGTMVYEYYPLHEACNRGYDGVVLEFVSARCELDKPNHDADTPLHVACMRGHIQCVHILLRAGSDCNLRNKLGHTPLQCAVYHDRNDLVELFKAHNKGIETTPPGTVSTLVATSSSGVKVQRSHSFNAAGSVSGIGGSGDHQHRRAAGSRVRASHVRPQSYYEDSGASSLVIGQNPLTSFATSQSMQSLSGTSSSSLSSYSTISTHIPTSSYKTQSPDSPVELDAPKRPLDPPPHPAHSANTAQSMKKSPPKCSLSSRPYSKPSEDFGTKHGTGKGFIVADAPLKKQVEGGGRELVASLCPFPSPGGQKMDPSERKLNPPRHPLLASARSDHHRHHGDKVLHEQLSHPELNPSKRDIQITNRAKSFDVVLETSSRREKSDVVPPVSSPTREHISSLAKSLCTSQDHHSHHLHPTSLSSSSPPPLHPVLLGVRACLASQAHRFGLSPDHQRCISELAAPHPSLPSLDSSSPLSSSLQPSFQEVDFQVVEGPLDSEVWVEESDEAFATLLLKVQVCDPLVQLRSQMNQGDIVLLKVRVRLEPESGSLGSTSLGLLAGSLPEVALLRNLPPHPNITSVLYHCRGRTEKFCEYLMHSVVVPGHTPSSCGPRSDSILWDKSGSGTTECGHDRPMYNPATTGTFLFQSAPGVSLEKYFSDFLHTDQKEVAIEDKFLNILAQLLLAVAHLQKNLVSHCSISSRNVYISDKGGKVVLGDFGQALNLRPKNLDVFRKSIKQLKASKTRKLSPEAEQGLASCDTDSVTSASCQELQNLEESFSMSDSYAVGALFYDLFSRRERSCSDTETPFIHFLSFRCNHLLQKLVARNPSDRFSALQGAISCFVLLFGPRTSEISSLSDCLQWLVSESMELYLKPVLRDSVTCLSEARDTGCKGRLRYSYLISARPEIVYNSCKFFNSD